MAADNIAADNLHLVARVLDELDRNAVVHRSADELLDETELTDSSRQPRQAAIERETMLRRLPVE